MTRRILATLISGMLLIAAIGFAPVRAQTAKQLQATEKARASILRLGVGQTSRIEVKLRDQSKVKGYVSEAGQDFFTVTDLKTGGSQRLAYSEVMEVKRPDGGVSTRTWIIIGAVAAAAVIVGIAVKPAFCDGGAQNRFPC